MARLPRARARLVIALAGPLAMLACSDEPEVGVGPLAATPSDASVVEDGAASAPSASPSAPSDAGPDMGAFVDAADAAPAVVYSGEATWYDAHAGNACGIPLAGSDYLVAAMNKPQYKKSLCGQCARVKGPKGEVTVRLVDLCPGCKSGDLDLSEEAFVHVSPLSAGRVKITWSFTPCP